MNNVLQLKGQFQSQPNTNGGGGVSLPKGSCVTAEHIKALRLQLNAILEYWKTDHKINGALVTAYYKNVVAKSNRIKGLLHIGSADPNDAIRGSKFYGEDPIQHVFTYYVKLVVLEESIRRLAICEKVVVEKYGGVITTEDIALVGKPSGKYKIKELAPSNFAKVIADIHYLQKFDIDRNTEISDETSIVTIYKTDVKTKALFDNLGIGMIDAKIIDETTIRLDKGELTILKDKAAYLIAMEVRDLSDMVPIEDEACDSEVMQIPSPTQEATVGVIDTPFCEDVYFKDWVAYTSMIAEGIELSQQDYTHGTAVTSLIVDGPAINPDLDDGCGRFRVRHFGVAKQGPFSAFTVLKAIRQIVAQNRDIRVWNLSLGSAMEINRNFISPEAAELDKIQCEYDVVFIVAGTNKARGHADAMRIGAPADSLNAIVVNAVDFDDKVASYHRVGPVLSFFNKPDISYYGGDADQKIRVCTPTGESFVSGTSFAAPWIARKMAYLIHNMGFTREVAKALLIDAAAGWNRKDDVSHSLGYGIVPKRIESIIQTSNEEIRFILTGSADDFETYTYNIPMPINNGAHPFYARATLCYFPKCSRQQGVDYTSTEMDIHFGRLKDEEKRAVIKSINQNRQSDEGVFVIREENARKLYRKWDNVKLISEEIKRRAVSRVAYASGMWGLSIKTKERSRTKKGKGLQFGVVITLKEMFGKNRYDEFMKLCMLRGWIVNSIDADNRFEVYTKAEEELTLE